MPPSFSAWVRASTVGPGSKLAMIATLNSPAITAGIARSGSRPSARSPESSERRRRRSERRMPRSSRAGVTLWTIAATAMPVVRVASVGCTRTRRGSGRFKNSPARKRLSRMARSPLRSRNDPKARRRRRMAAARRKVGLPARTLRCLDPRADVFWRFTSGIPASDLRLSLPLGYAAERGTLAHAVPRAWTTRGLTPRFPW